jgi:hypothetical protein
MVGLISTITIAYQERLRDWSYDARQPAEQGANSSKMIFILGDKALNNREMPFLFRKAFLMNRGGLQ